MNSTQYKVMQFPVKVGDDSRVIQYAASLSKGEEQLLITRQGNIFLTDGAGGFTNIKNDPILTKENIDNIIAANTDLNKKLEDLEDLIRTKGTDSDANIESLKEELLNDIDSLEKILKNETNNLVSTLKNEIYDSILNLQEQITANEEAKGSLQDIDIKSTLPSFSIYPTIESV